MDVPVVLFERERGWKPGEFAFFTFIRQAIVVIRRNVRLKIPNARKDFWTKATSRSHFHSQLIPFFRWFDRPTGRFMASSARSDDLFMEQSQKRTFELHTSLDFSRKRIRFHISPAFQIGKLCADYSPTQIV
jgi:hypothetical protein